MKLRRVIRASNRFTNPSDTLPCAENSPVNRSVNGVAAKMLRKKLFFARFPYPKPNTEHRRPSRILTLPPAIRLPSPAPAARCQIVASRAHSSTAAKQPDSTSQTAPLQPVLRMNLKQPQPEFRPFLDRLTVRDGFSESPCPGKDAASAGIGRVPKSECFLTHRQFQRSRDEIRGFLDTHGQSVTLR